MLTSLKLLLPALLPSWRFFDFIVASPRVQYALLDLDQHPVSEWQEFRPRPQHVSLLTMLRRLFWNPQWNETLFITSCAERIMAEPASHAEAEIFKRLLHAWRSGQLAGPDNAMHLQFRLLFVERTGEQLQQSVRFTSRCVPLPERA